MSTETAFYVTCGLMVVVGVVLLLVSVAIDRWTRAERTSEFLAMLALCCGLVGPLMAVIGPRS